MGIKILFKNVIKLFLNKKFQLLAISIIIFLSSFIYTTMFLATDSLATAVGDIQENYGLEDFSLQSVDAIYPEELSAITTMLPANFDYSLSSLYHLDETLFDTIMNNRMAAFKAAYPDSDYELMIREYQDLALAGDHNFRVYKNSDTINRTYVESGTLPSGDDQIGINATYAAKNNLEIGDMLTIANQEYLITAFILFPDFNLPLTNNQFIIDSSKNGVAVFTDDQFDRLQGRFGFYVSGIYRGTTIKSDFENAVMDQFDSEAVTGITSITLTENQTRSGAIYEEISGGQAMTLAIALNIALIAVIVVAIITYRILNGQKTQIGLLKSLGYLSSEIAIPYVILIAIASLPMLVLGHVAGNFAGYSMKQLYLEFYMLPNGPVSGNIMVMVTAIAVPFVFISGMSYLVIYRMLAKRPLALLSPHTSNKLNIFTKMVSRVLAKAKARVKFKYSYLTQSFGKLAVFVVGIFFAAFLLIFSTMLVGFVEKSSNDYYQSKAYAYEGYVDVLKEVPTLQDGDEKFIDGQVVFAGDSINVKGIEPDNELFKLYDRSGAEITALLESGVIVNRALATQYDLAIGQKIDVRLQNETYQTKVAAIAGNYFASYMYMDRETLSNMIGGRTALFTGVYSQTELDSDDYALVIVKAEILNQAANMQQFMSVAVYSMVAAAVAIAVLILYILTTLTVEENYYSISLLKVIGYNRRELRSMVLSSYLVYCIIIYIVTIPVAIGALNLMVSYMVREFNMYLPFEFNPLLAGGGLALMVVIYLLGTLNANHKIRKVAIQEVLKAYQE